VTSTCNYSPVVANLDRSLEFYRRIAGLEFGTISVMGPAQTVFLDIHGITAANAAMRWVISRIPGQRCGVEPLEFGNIDRRAIEPRPQDPGATTVILIVRDIVPVVERIRSAGIPILRAAGDVIHLPNGAGASVIVRDPDGHLVEFLQPGGSRETSAAALDSNIAGWRVRVAVRDTEASIDLYRDRLGFRVQPGQFAHNKAFADLNGLKDVPVRITNADVPDGPGLELVEFRDLPRAPLQARIQDPGATRFQLMVPDARRAAALVKEAGGEIISTRGEVFALGGRPGSTPTQVVTVRDMNGLYLEVVQRP
jgi:catechol 2,3-dioxygenase-like lactoylglutathione lyase family enzyme